MRKIVHLRLDKQTACGLNIRTIKYADTVTEITCHNCEDVLKSRSRAAYWDYERASKELSAAEPELHSFISDLTTRFPYMQGEVTYDTGHIGRKIRFWIPLKAHNGKTHTLNVSHTADPLYIAVRPFNEGERAMLADLLAEVAERLHLRIKMTGMIPELTFTVKPFFHKRGER